MSIIGDAILGGDMEGVLTSSDHYKRAVYRAAPHRFTIEMLPPAKHGGDFSYGVIVHPIRNDAASISSWGTSYHSYEIWRRWSDCLLWQDTLEAEYTRMARSKKQRLVAGKGVKKNGVYIHDHAASFESLPPGPNPNSVHLDIHNYLPTLTKKGTLFRTSPATADQRTREIRALIESLFSPDAPMLIVELREDRVVTDFFGYWRRDYDYAQKLKQPDTKTRNSVSSSVFSLYFSNNIGEDTPTSTPPSSPSRSSKSRRPSTASSTTSSITTSPSRKSTRAPPSLASTDRSFRRPSRRGTPPSPSSSSSDGGSSRDSKGSDHHITLDDVSIVIASNPDEDEDILAPEVPPKERAIKINRDEILVPSHRRETRPMPINTRAGNRNGQVFVTTPVLASSPTESTSSQDHDEVSVFDSDLSDRTSWMTSMSVTNYLEQLGLPLGSPDTEYSFRDSVATFRTDCSADGVLGRHNGLSHHTRSVSAGPYRRGVSILDEGDLNDDLMSYLNDSLNSPLPASDAVHRDTGSSAMSAPTRHVTRFFRNRASSLNSVNTFTSTSTSSTSSDTRSISTVTNDDARSVAGTIASTTSAATASTTATMMTTSTGSGMSTIGVKVAYDDSIIMLRVPRTITLTDMRHRLHDKLVRQEKVSLGKSFSIARVIQTSPLKSAFAQTLPGRASSIPRMRMIESQEDWDQVVESISGTEKLSLRVLV